KNVLRLKLVIDALAAIGFVLFNLVTGCISPRSQHSIQGISVDAIKGKIRCHKVSATGVELGYIRATNGAGKRDAHFIENLNGARDAGVRYGAIHEYNMCRLANDQAAMFVTTVPRDVNILPPAVRLAYHDDCEERPGRALILSELNTFLNQIEGHSGKPAIIILSEQFEEEYNISSGINRTFWLESNFFP